jgi:hypothetical protein
LRNLFGHLLPLSDDAVEVIWKLATLTVDANVLLDLYRYHPETRDALIQSLRAFRGRLWLSHQAASEFVRNRARAAASVSKELSDADGDLNALKLALKKATDDLRGRRPLPREIGQRLKSDIEAAIATAEAAIEEVRTRRADGGPSDSVLDEVLCLFDGCVGSVPADAELTELHKEAERRTKERVPPGYEDAKKDGTKAHGDFLLWHQVLQQAKSTARPVVLVTSERKEDWWDRAHGKTVGPRLELLDEAQQVAGQRVLIYQTHSFIERAVGPLNGWLAALVVDDIRREDLEDATAAAEIELDELMTTLVGKLGDDLISSDASVRRLVAETKADGWHVHDVEVTNIEPVENAFAQFKFTALVHYASAPIEDRHMGPEIQAQLRGSIALKNGSWAISGHEIESAKIEQDAGRISR